jgi:UDP-N-acetylmuramate: L-alanyl-gamma-D-glutamyl-meso-diaminopimelate ligase
VGFGKNAGHRITHFRETAKGTRFRVNRREFRLALPGRMNAFNAALASVAAARSGISIKNAAAALENFPGVEGRLELLTQVGQSFLYTDEAYHPLAVGALLDALKKKHPGRRLVVIFEPRLTGGRHAICQRELPDSLKAASLVIAAPHADNFRFDQPFDDGLLHRNLRKLGVRVAPLPAFQDALEIAPGLCQNGDVVLIVAAAEQAALLSPLCNAIEQKLLFN